MLHHNNLRSLVHKDRQQSRLPNVDLLRPNLGWDTGLASAATTPTARATRVRRFASYQLRSRTKPSDGRCAEDSHRTKNGLSEQGRAFWRRRWRWSSWRITRVTNLAWLFLSLRPCLQESLKENQSSFICTPATMEAKRYTMIKSDGGNRTNIHR